MHIKRYWALKKHSGSEAFVCSKHRHLSQSLRQNNSGL